MTVASLLCLTNGMHSRGARGGLPALALACVMLLVCCCCCGTPVVGQFADAQAEGLHVLSGAAIAPNICGRRAVQFAAEDGQGTVTGPWLQPPPAGGTHIVQFAYSYGCEAGPQTTPGGNAYVVLEVSGAQGGSEADAEGSWTAVFDGACRPGIQDSDCTIWQDVPPSTAWAMLDAAPTPSWHSVWLRLPVLTGARRYRWRKAGSGQALLAAMYLGPDCGCGARGACKTGGISCSCEEGYELAEGSCVPRADNKRPQQIKDPFDGFILSAARWHQQFTGVRLRPWGCSTVTAAGAAVFDGAGDRRLETVDMDMLSVPDGVPYVVRFDAQLGTQRTMGADCTTGMSVSRSNEGLVIRSAPPPSTLHPPPSTIHPHTRTAIRLSACHRH